jgi:hypothetical protein
MQGSAPCLLFESLPPVAFSETAGYAIPIVIEAIAGVPPPPNGSIFFFFFARFTPVVGFVQHQDPSNNFTYYKLAPPDPQTLAGSFTFVPSQGPLCTSTLAMMKLSWVEPLTAAPYWMFSGIFAPYIGPSNTQARAPRRAHAESVSRLPLLGCSRRI